jgi:hypothetical protein
MVLPKKVKPKGRFANMSEFTKEEMARIKIKENENRQRAIENSAKHDAQVIDNLKSKLGFGSAPAATPAPAPVQAPQAPAGMKKGGAVKKFRHHDGIAQRGKTRA